MARKYKGVTYEKTKHGYQSGSLKAERITGIKSLIDLRLNEQTVKYVRFGTWIDVKRGDCLKNDGTYKDWIEWIDGNRYWIS